MKTFVVVEVHVSAAVVADRGDGGEGGGRGAAGRGTWLDRIVCECAVQIRLRS